MQDNSTLMKTRKDELGEYYLLEYTYEERKNREHPSPISIALIECETCRKEFEKGDKAYSQALFAYNCTECQEKKVTAEQL